MHFFNGSVEVESHFKSTKVCVGTQWQLSKLYMDTATMDSSLKDVDGNPANPLVSGVEIYKLFDPQTGNVLSRWKRTGDYETGVGAEKNTETWEYEGPDNSGSTTIKITITAVNQLTRASADAPLIKKNTLDYTGPNGATYHREFVLADAYCSFSANGIFPAAYDQGPPFVINASGKSGRDGMSDQFDQNRSLALAGESRMETSYFGTADGVAVPQNLSYGFLEMDSYMPAASAATP